MKPQHSAIASNKVDLPLIPYKPETPIKLKDDAAQEAQVFLTEYNETKKRFDKVAKLIEGFESHKGMELLSTVHWVATQDTTEKPSDEEIVERVHAWSTRKAQMKSVHILAAWNRLQEQDWLSLKAPT